MPIVVVKSKGGSRSYLLREGRPMFIGRAKECDILLPSAAVSRRHAVILFKNGICGIKDLGSFNGTLINDQLINEPRQIAETDVVRISSFIIRLHMNTDEAEEDSPPPPLRATEESPEDTVDLAMETLPQDAKPKSPRPDSPHYGDSSIPIPRAMRMDDSVSIMINAIQPNPERVRDLVDDEVNAVAYRPGRDTIAFIDKENRLAAEEARAAAKRSPEETDAPPPAPVAAEKPSFPRPDETAFFTEPPVPQDPDPPTGSSDLVVDITAEPVLSHSEAEAVIPLMEPEVAPTLTLEEDEVTNAALEKLIEDLPTYKRERIEESHGPAVAEIAPESFLDAPVEDAASDASLPVPDGEAPAESVVATETGEYDFKPSDTGFHGGIVADARLRPDTDMIAPPPVLEGVENITISQQMMSAVNTRLSLYALLSDLSEERKLLRSRAGGLLAEVTEELDRQDAEMDNLPTADEATRLIEALHAARDNDKTLGLEQSSEMRAAEEMAVSQWMLIRDSNLEALPAVYKEAYRLAADEPLAQELTQAEIPHGRLLGGAIYLLALEILAASATTERKRISTRIRRLADEGVDTGNSGVLAKLGRLGKLANNLKNRAEIREETARLQNEGKSFALRADLARREMKFLVRALNIELQQVYRDAARHYIPRTESMPVAVRAFLRYGAVGFKPWWMNADTRDFILADCENNVRQPGEREWDGLNILYADEYLAAVAEMECSPSPNDKLADPEGGSIELKTDRAYRRIVNARTYNVLMEKMLSDLDDRMRRLEAESDELEKRVAEARKAPPSKKEALFDLQTEHQAVAIRKSNLEKHVKRIEKEVVASIIESVQESEGRFRKGELTMPDADFLIRREVGALFEFGRRMAGRREQFIPMALRQYFPLDKDVVNTRDAVRGEMADLETRDPGVFVNVVIPAKKKINRVEFRVGPTLIIMPSVGQRGFCSMGREGMEGGHLVVPVCFNKEGIRDRQLTHMLADFRWETSRSMGGRDVMNSDTLVGAFMRLRWEWRNYPKTKREKGLIFNEMNDVGNWRRVYELYMSEAMNGGKQLFLRNPEFYNAVIGKFIDLPQGVPMLRRSSASPE